MNEAAINEEYERIIHFLDQKRLSEALNRLEVFTQDISDWGLKNSLEELQTSYRYMLQYMQQGITDPERNNLYRKLLATAYKLTDKARIGKLTPNSTEYYYDRRRYHKFIPLRTLPAVQLELESYTEDMAVGKLLHYTEKQAADLAVIRKRHEIAVSELFYILWLADHWEAQEEEEARNFLQSSLVQVNDLCLFVSALTLSLMQYFDIRKFMLLFDAYQHSANDINQRAIVGLALIIYHYDKRLSLYPEVAARLKLLNEDAIFANNLSVIQIQLLRCRETEKIDKKMREEILPELMKNPNLKNIKFNNEAPDEESGQNDKNPDWEDWMDQSGLNDKLKEMNELQMEGADVYMSTFAQLKTYPFFREMANWFYPFDMQHSSVVQTFSTTPVKRDVLLDTIYQSGFFCNSDKYSFCFTMMQVPEAQREMMAQQFEAQNEAINESNSYDKILAFAQHADTISNQYIHDLYRFFRIHPRRHEFKDPFMESLNLQHCVTLKDTVSDTSNQLTLAGYFFHKNYLIEAWLLYEDIVKDKKGDAEIYQKMGYCMQKNKGYEKAIEAYLQSDILKPDSIWTNRHLAMCYRQLNQLDKALLYYQKVEAAQPDNLNVLTQIGHCLVGLKRYDEALNYFFKVDYIDSELPKIWRAIAWCSFVIGKHEQAMKYYHKLLEKETQLLDYLNAGHVAWSLGQLEKAVKMYATSLAMSDNQESFLELFNKDKEDLIKQGIKEDDIPLMLDLLRYYR